MFSKIPNRMFSRLETLDKYFQSCEINDSKMRVRENTLKEKDGTVLFEFISNQGTVLVNLFRYYLDGITYQFSYTTYAGIKLFEIEATRDCLDVKPCMGYSYNVDAKNIDLAILELEEYLKLTYGDIDEKWEQYQLEEKLAWESHKEQLKELL